MNLDDDEREPSGCVALLVVLGFTAAFWLAVTLTIARLLGRI